MALEIVQGFGALQIGWQMEKGHEFRDPRPAARRIGWSAGILICLLVLSAAALFFDVSFIEAMKLKDYSARLELVSRLRIFLLATQILTYVSLAAIVLTMVWFLMWVYRAVSNLLVMGAELQFGAGGSVGIFFIPVMNLFLPPVMMSGVRRASIDALAWRDLKFTLLIPVWWTLQIIVSFGGLALAFATPGKNSSIDAFEGALMTNAIYELPEIALYFTIAYLVWRISEDQYRQWMQRKEGVITPSETAHAQPGP